MPASVPLMVIPVMVTVLLVPMFLFAKVAAALVVVRVTTSEPCLPTRAAEVFTSCAVADVDALYVRSVAVTPETVSSLAVIEAVVLGWVSV